MIIYILIISVEFSQIWSLPNAINSIIICLQQVYNYDVFYQLWYSRKKNLLDYNLSDKIIIKLNHGQVSR